MKKERIIVLFAVFFLTAALASTALGESRRAAVIDLNPHSCWVPYNIKTSDGMWATGLNITTDWTDETITAVFFKPGTSASYASAAVPLDAGGMWTGMVQNLLATPGDFVSGSLVIFYSAKGFFSVTQFIVCAIPSQFGFGHQTFYASPGAVL